MYLNLIQIAESFGVSEKVVEEWIRREGLHHTPDRGRLLFDRAQVADWAAVRGLAAKAGFLAPVTPAFATGVSLEGMLRTGGVWRGVPASGFLEVLVKVVSALPATSQPLRQFIIQGLRARGGVNIAPVGGGIALPHPSARIALGRESGTVALVLLDDPLTFAEPPADSVPITRLFFFIAPSPRAHLDLLGRLSRSLARGPLRDLVVRGAPDDEILKAAADADRAAPGAKGGDAT